MPIPSVLCSSSSTSTLRNQPQESEEAVHVESTAPLDRYKTESDEGDEEQVHQSSSAATLHAINAPNPPAEESQMKRVVQSGSRHQLVQRTFNRIRRSRQQEEQVLVFESAESELPVAPGAEESASVESPTQQPNATDFAQEIESEAAEIRTLIARTAQLWSAMDQAEHTQDLPCQQPMRCFPASALYMSLPAQIACIEDDNSTLTSDNEDFVGDEETETETESVDMVLQNMTRSGSSFSSESIGHSISRISSSDTQSSRSLEEQRSVGERVRGLSYDSEDVEEESDAESDGLQREQGEVIDTSNQAINVSKARDIKNAMLENLLLLNFREDITRTALEAGVLEIDHYDSDCELAYVDIFMLLVKMVCDAHIDALNEEGDIGQSYAEISDDNEQVDSMDDNSSSSSEPQEFLPFKWPVFDMAQFEFGSARSGTCFDSVCVLINLPKVSVDRMEELVEILSCNLFSMIGDPIQVVIPSASSTRRTKGHAFLEFDDQDMAQRCASAVDGLTWGRGPLCRIRGNLFRQYQVKTFVHRECTPSLSSDRASFPSPLSDALRSESFRNTRVQRFDQHENRPAWRRRFRASVEHQNVLCCSDEECSDTGEWIDRHPLANAPLRPSSLRELSLGCVDRSGQSEQYDTAMQPNWDDENERFSLQQSEGDIANDESSDSSSALISARPDDTEVEEPSSTVASTGTGFAREPFPDSDDTVEPLWAERDDDNDCVEKPWRRYCEDLVVRNREMQKQLTLARGRIVQLRHNNQKLHLLIDRVERDREGLVFENKFLQTQLHGYEDHEQQQDSLIKELVSLQNRVAQQDRSPCGCSLESQQLHTLDAVDRSIANASTVFHDIRAALSHVSIGSLAHCRIEELKDWEQELEDTLSRVRSVKEDKALEMQKKLDRRVVEQHELKLCVICLSNEKSVLCLPCRHLCLCKTCSRRQEVTKCPICRLEIDEMLAVYS